MITLASLMTQEERTKCSYAEESFKVSQKLFIDITVEDLIRLTNLYDIFNHIDTAELFTDLYTRFGDRCRELKIEWKP